RSTARCGRASPKGRGSPRWIRAFRSPKPPPRTRGCRRARMWGRSCLWWDEPRERPRLSAVQERGPNQEDDLFPMNMRNLLLPATALSLALAACSQQPAETETTQTASYDGEVVPEGKAAEAPPPIKPTDVPTRGGDGSPIELATLTEADVSGAKLKGELACSFADDEGAQPILLAQGDVASEEPSRGIVKVGDTIETVSANGGFDA